MIDATDGRTAEGTVKFSPIFPSPHGAAEAVVEASEGHQWSGNMIPSCFFRHF